MKLQCSRMIEPTSNTWQRALVICNPGTNLRSFFRSLFRSGMLRHYLHIYHPKIGQPASIWTKNPCLQNKKDTISPLTEIGRTIGGSGVESNAQASVVTKCNWVQTSSRRQSVCAPLNLVAGAEFESAKTLILSKRCLPNCITRLNQTILLSNNFSFPLRFSTPKKLAT